MQFLTVFAKNYKYLPNNAQDLLNPNIRIVFGESLPDWNTRKKTNSIMMAKRKSITFLTMVALFSSFVLLTPSLPPLLPSLVEDAEAQTHPDGCEKCIVIEYEGAHTAVIGGVDSFTNMTTRQEQYNSYLWQFVNNLVSDGFEINAVTTDDIRCEDDKSTERMHHIVLDVS